MRLLFESGDYSRAASISFRACSGAATIREQRLFERGIYSVIYGTLFPASLNLPDPDMPTSPCMAFFGTMLVDYMLCTYRHVK